MSGNSVTLHRVLKAAPEKVFRAFADVRAFANWIPPYGFLCEVQKFDFREGGNFSMSFINFSTGTGQSFGGKFLEIRNNEYLRYSDKFDDPNLPGELVTTVWLNKVICGTDLKIVQENIPSVIPVEMCYLGWQDSLDKLIRLTDPEIPDA
jgi:uncharacterized protein YndB with AHSA1/START domain